MPLHPSQVYEDAHNLIESAFELGLNYQSIAKLTKVSDSTVRNWHRRRRAKRPIIQPLIEYVEQKQQNLSAPNAIGIYDNNDHDFKMLIKRLKTNLIVKIENYISGKRDHPPIEDVQLINLLTQLQNNSDK
jgi:hypothetical protein